MPGIIGSYIGESYRIESELGSGGMGDVYRATELATGDEVAIKVIKHKAIADPDRLRRFRNEAKAASSIRHPNIVAVREVGAGEIDGQMRDYIVMELVTGSTLQSRIDGRPLLLNEALHFAIQIVSALEAAHKAGVVHRDVKPANVMIDATSTAKLADFGLAKIAGPPADPFAETGSMQLDLTNEGSIIGSVSYMSPEQARGLDVDFRSDIFSFGAVLYELLSGRPAFDGATRADRFSAVLTADPADIPNLPPDLSVILMRCLRKDSTRRWQSASELRSALEDLQHALASGNVGSSSTANNAKWTRRMVLAAAGGAALGSVPAYYLGSRRKEQPSFQRLTFRSGDITGAKFAAGDLVAFSAAWDGGPSSLYTCQPGNREPRALGLPGNRLKGVTAAGQAALLGDDAGSTLSIVSLGGGEPRPKLTEVLDACWAPDGENLAVSQQMNATQFRVDFPIGTKRHECVQRPPESLRLSPTGRELAFFEFVPQAADYQIVVLKLQEASARPQVISTGWRAVSALQWTPDARELWFTGARANEDPAFYAVQMDGKQRLVAQTPDFLYLHDMHPQKKVLVAPTQSRLTIRVGGAGRAEKSYSWLDTSIAYDISSDDRYVLFSELGYAQGRNPFIYVRDLDGTPARRVGEGNRPALSPDNRLVACTKAAGANYNLAILPNGAGQEVTRSLQGWSFELADWLPDSRTLLVLARKGGDPPSTYLWKPDGREPGPRIAPPGVRAIKASPDGLFSAGVVQGMIQSFSLSGDGASEPRTITKAVEGEQILRWTKQGVFTRHRVSPSTTCIDRVDPVSGQRTRVYEFSLPEGSLGFNEPTVLSPSGKVYAFTHQRDIASLYLATGLS